MITSVYLSNNMIQIVQGDKSAKLPNISKVIQEEVLEGSILNGIITNDQELYEQLKEIWSHHQLPTKDVELVLNSAKITSKNIIVPNQSPKAIQKLLPLEFTDISPTEAVIYDYAYWNPVKEKGMTEILAVTVEESHLQSFVDLFKRLNISLGRITFARTAIHSYLMNIKELSTDANIILMIDGNSLISILWVEGKFSYMDKKRLFVEPGSDGFITEAVRTVSNINQLHSSQKIEAPIKKIYTTGFSDLDIQNSNEQMIQVELPYQMEPLPGAHSDAIFAGGGLVRGKKDLNLLDTMKSKKKANPEKENLLSKFIPAIIVLAVCVVASVALFVMVFLKTNELDDLTSFNTTSLEAQTAMKYDNISQEVSKMQAVVRGVTQMLDTLDTYPMANSQVQNQITTQAGGDIQVEFVGYSSDTGSLDMVMTVDRPEVIHEFINRLYNTGLFWNVEYSGYTFVESSGKYTIDVSCYLAQNAGR